MRGKCFPSRTRTPHRPGDLSSSTSRLSPTLQLENLSDIGPEMKEAESYIHGYECTRKCMTWKNGSESHRKCSKALSGRTGNTLFGNTNQSSIATRLTKLMDRTALIAKARASLILRTMHIIIGQTSHTRFGINDFAVSDFW
jgi:hypothetical protein